MAILSSEPVPFDPRQPFSRADARRAGLSLREMLGPRYHTIFYAMRVLSTVPITFLDLAAAGLDLVDLVVPGDSLVRRCRLSASELVSAAATWLGLGARGARRAARYVREGVDSPMESRLRMLIVLAGLPEPTVNRILRHPDGERRKRFDLSYPGLRLIIAYDGRQHAESSRQWQHDLRRREQIDGWVGGSS